MSSQTSTLIERLCQGKECCVQCGDKLEIVLDCIIMNQCGHMLHERCFRNLKDLQQYNCRDCGKKILMNFVLNQPHVIEVSHNCLSFEQIRRTDIEQTLQQQFLDRINKISWLEQQLSQQNAEIAQLKRRVSESSTLIDEPQNDQQEDIERYNVCDKQIATPICKQERIDQTTNSKNSQHQYSSKQRSSLRFQKTQDSSQWNTPIFDQPQLNLSQPESLAQPQLLSATKKKRVSFHDRRMSLNLIANNNSSENSYVIAISNEKKKVKQFSYDSPSKRKSKSSDYYENELKSNHSRESLDFNKICNKFAASESRRSSCSKDHTKKKSCSSYEKKQSIKNGSDQNPLVEYSIPEGISSTFWSQDHRNQALCSARKRLTLLGKKESIHSIKECEENNKQNILPMNLPSPKHLINNNSKRKSLRNSEILQSSAWKKQVKSSSSKNSLYS